MCGVDGRAIGVGLVPVLFESFLDSALGGGELHGCGFFGGVQDRLGTGGVGWGVTAPATPLVCLGDGGADRPPLGERVIQLGRPANLILEPEQLPGQVARIGNGPRRNDMSAAQEVFVGIDVSKEWFDVSECLPGP